MNAYLSDGIVRRTERCPHCGVANPLLSKFGKARLHGRSQFDNHWYFTAVCSKCNRVVLFYGSENSRTAQRDDQRDDEPSVLTVKESFPSLEQAAQELPQAAHRFYQQALESKHAPDGALMLAASAIDAMLKDKGYAEGTLFKRIGSAAGDHLLTADMQAWAHEIRLSANEPRHADEDFKGATEQDAEQILAFVRALGEYLYVLPARVMKWKEKASETV